MDHAAPKNESELVEVVRGCLARGQRAEIVAGGSKRALGRATKAGTILDVSSLSGVISYEPDELVFRARAATPLAEVDAILAQKRQMLAFAPSDWGPVLGGRMKAATLGGIVASNACGARRVKAGAVRDHLIGCRFVNGGGETVNAGGQVVKNVTGFDIPKLMCGAFGTLGVMSELTFRVVPKPTRSAVLSLRGAEVGQGLRALRRAAAMPLEATGLSYLPRAALPVAFAHLAGPHGVALVRVEGEPDPVAEKLQRLQAAFAPLDPVVVDDDLGASLFRGIDDGTFLALSGHDLWRAHLPSSSAKELLKDIAPSLWLADCAGALLWLAMPADGRAQTRLVARANELQGHVSLFRASEATRATVDVFPRLDPQRQAITRAVKMAFDPQRIFNPGRMYEGI